MSMFDIHLGPLEKQSGDKITANIYVLVAGNAFPEAGWNDFALVVLSWWYEGLVAAGLGRSKSITCSFMDGPFSFEFRDADLDQWRLITKSGDATLISLEIARDEVVAAFQRTAQHIQNPVHVDFVVGDSALAASLRQFCEIFPQHEKG